MLNCKRHALTVGLVSVLIGLMPAAFASTCQARSPLTVVPVVELYTSQGCSSCPPADQWIAQLRDHPQAVALAFHGKRAVNPPYASE